MAGQKGIVQLLQVASSLAAQAERACRAQQGLGQGTAHSHRERAWICCRHSNLQATTWSGAARGGCPGEVWDSWCIVRSSPEDASRHLPGRMVRPCL